MKRLFTALLCLMFGIFAACTPSDANGSSDDEQKEEPVSNQIFPERTDYKTDGQRYAGGEVQFPAQLWQTPEVERYTELDIGSGTAFDPYVNGYFIDSIAGTKVFAFVGFPPNASAENPVPGIVLVHGATATAFTEWVQYWVRRGYAAIAMDTEGHMPTEFSAMTNTSHVDSIRPHGPAASNSDYNKPVEEQWMYHAIASVVVSTSFLRSFPQVDSDRIGITGISQGGRVTTQVAAYDDRYCFAVPIYCSLERKLSDKPDAQVERFCELWDNIEILSGCKIPFLYVNSNIDTNSPESTSATAAHTEYCQMVLRYGLAHGQTVTKDFAETNAFADNICFDKPGLIQITKQPTAEDRTVEFKLPKGVEISRVYAYYTRDSKQFLGPTTVWRDIEGTTVEGNKITIGEIPEDATRFYVNLMDDRNLEVSTYVVKL